MSVLIMLMYSYHAVLITYMLAHFPQSEACK